MIYNGKPEWWPPAELGELIVPPPPGLEGFVPRLRYFALDEGRVPKGRLRELGKNLVAALIRLETSATSEELAAQLGPLDEWLVLYPDLRRAFEAWLRTALVRKGIFGIEVPEEVDDLGELRAMLKFGRLDAATRRRIEAADSNEILRWADRILTAQRLPDVFDGK